MEPRFVSHSRVSATYQRISPAYEAQLSIYSKIFELQTTPCSGAYISSHLQHIVDDCTGVYIALFVVALLNTMGVVHKY